MRKYIAEFIGTYFLVLIIGCSVIGGLGNLAPLAIGICLMAMVYACGHVSGAHFNPAVTVGVCLRGACSWSEAPAYIAAQLIGSGLAAYTVSYLMGPNATAATIETMPGLLSEFIGTFALVYVILNVATTKRNEGNSYYGFAIGAIVTAMAYCFGGISGGAFNPAVAVGASMLNMLTFSDIWIHLTGSILGAVAATYIFLFTNGKE